MASIAGIPRHVEVADELVEEEPAQALGRTRIAGEKSPLDHLGQVDEGEYRPVEVGDIAPEHGLLVGGEALFGVGVHARPTIEPGWIDGGGWAGVEGQPSATPPAQTPRRSRSTASPAAAATPGSAAVWDTCWARSAMDLTSARSHPGPAHRRRGRPPRARWRRTPRGPTRPPRSPDPAARLAGARDRVDLLEGPDPLGQRGDRRHSAAPDPPCAASPSRSCGWPWCLPRRGPWWPGEATCPAWLEHQRRENPGEHRRLGLGEDLAERAPRPSADPTRGTAAPGRGRRR